MKNYIGENSIKKILTLIKGEFTPLSRKINGKSLEADIELSASDVGALSDTTEIPSIEGLATEEYVDKAIAAGGGGGGVSGDALLKTGDTMEGVLKFTEGVHYGEEVPAEGEEGQIFFQLGESLADILDDGSIGLSKLSEEIQNKINISEQLFAKTIAAADWTQHSGYADVSITVDGLNSSTPFDVDLNLPATGTMSVMRNQITAWGKVMRVNTTADNTVRFLYDGTAPTVALPIKIRWWR